MGRRSINPDKNEYWKAREAAGLTREEASEHMEYVSTDRIERIEYGKSSPHPEEVLAMADKYHRPILCNYYCTHDCPIGKDHVQEIKERSLSEIIIEMLNSLNKLTSEKDLFLQIVADGRISQEELPDFNRIQKQLDDMSKSINELHVWTDNVDSQANNK